MSNEPLEAETVAAGPGEPLEAEELPEGMDTGAGPEFEEAEAAQNEASRPSGMRERVEDNLSSLAIFGSFIIVALLLLAGWNWGWFEEDDDTPLDSGRPVVNGLRWYDPVWLPREPDCIDPGNGQTYPEYAIGYEPTIAVDEEGNLYYTAHKDLYWSGPGGGPLAVSGGGLGLGPFACNQIPNSDTSWDYYASWFYVSQDGGESWAMPPWGSLTDPLTGQPHASMLYGGDEGDIAIDDTQRVYFLDTYLLDNWIHRWDDGGDDYIEATWTQGSLAADDRPWLTAQGDGIVHYLGNSGTAIPDCVGGSGRYWYYRSDDGGYTFIQCEAMPGGWSHIDAERDGDHVYVVQEQTDSADADIHVRVSDDTGMTWADAQVIGPREANPPEGFPWISTGPASNEGLVGAIWADAAGGRTGPWRLHAALSFDYGVTWHHQDITPFEGLFFYPTIYVGPDNTMAIAFYGIEGDYTAGTPWHLYAAMEQYPDENFTFDFAIADPEPLHHINQWEVGQEDVHALHDFFEIAISPKDLSLNIAYQYNIDQHPFEDNEEQRYLMYVKADWVGD